MLGSREVVRGAVSCGCSSHGQGRNYKRRKLDILTEKIKLAHRGTHNSNNRKCSNDDVTDFPSILFSFLSNIRGCKDRERVLHSLVRASGAVWLGRSGSCSWWPAWPSLWVAFGTGPCLPARPLPSLFSQLILAINLKGLYLPFVHS